VQVKQNRVMRVLPLENDAINECWLSDKDRFSYEGLNSPDRLTAPMVKREGKWQEVDWETAFDFVSDALKNQEIGVLASPHSTLEELYLAGKLGAADFRLRHADFSADDGREGIPWLGMAIPELQSLDRVLVIGSFLRKEAPLLAHRLRQAAKRGAQIHMLHSVDDDWLMPIASKKIVAPSALVASISSFKDVLAEGKNAAVLIGNFAQQHPRAAAIHAAAQALGVKVGFLGEAANSVGGYVAGLPTSSLDTILQRKSFVLLNVEPELDCADPQAAMAALRAAQFVVQLSAWRTGLDYAHVLLPTAPFSETAGTFISIEGRLQSFHASVNPLGESRPAWKVLRVLGSLLGMPGMEFDSIDQVRAACLDGRDVSKLLSNGIKAATTKTEKGNGIQRIADVPVYFADPLVRRSPPLQKTRDARPPKAWMNSTLMGRLGISAGQPILVNAKVKLITALDDKLPDECVRIAAAHASTAALGPMFGTLSLEKVSAERAA
ncbi:MAG TPA: molybdopterin-dependent oxidoreductase, partial [Burkholderiales bacterium]|nr:molybdopterin-dependent oxidoreductase [Burkholderiales bacterium]